MRKVLAGCLTLGVLCIGVVEVPIVVASAGDEPADTEYVIVLGAGLNGSVPSRILHDRLLKAEQWLTDHPDSKAILSGGQGPVSYTHLDMRNKFEQLQLFIKFITHINQTSR